MAGYRQGRRVLTLRQILARKKRPVKYTDYRAQRPIQSPATVTGQKINGTDTR
jgi:hypothetical protein